MYFHNKAINVRKPLLGSFINKHSKNQVKPKSSIIWITARAWEFVGAPAKHDYDDDHDDGDNIIISAQNEWPTF